MGLMEREHVQSWMERVKSKVRSLKRGKKTYKKMAKTSSMKLEINSRQAQKIVNETLKAADRPGKTSIPS